MVGLSTTTACSGILLFPLNGGRSAVHAVSCFSGNLPTSGCVSVAGIRCCDSLPNIHSPRAVLLSIISPPEAAFVLAVQFGFQPMRLVSKYGSIGVCPSNGMIVVLAVRHCTLVSLLEIEDVLRSVNCWSALAFLDTASACWVRPRLARI